MSPWMVKTFDWFMKHGPSRNTVQRLAVDLAITPAGQWGQRIDPVDERIRSLRSIVSEAIDSLVRTVCNSIYCTTVAVMM
jgi:hypothetical protein